MYVCMYVCMYNVHQKGRIMHKNNAQFETQKLQKDSTDMRWTLLPIFTVLLSPFSAPDVVIRP